MKNNTARIRVLLRTAISLGVVQFLAGGFLLCGGGPGASLLPGTNAAWDRLLIGFLLTGPMSLLPASVLAIWRPRLAGFWLVVTAMSSAGFAVLVMTPAQPDVWAMDRAMWPDAESLSFYTFKWSITLILPFSLPMLALGLWLWGLAVRTTVHLQRSRLSDNTE